MFLRGASNNLVGINFFWGTSNFDSELYNILRMKDLWKSSGWAVEIKRDREATLRRQWYKYHLQNIHRFIWHRWCKSCLNCHFLRLEVYLSNQEYSNLAAACFEPIFFSMLRFLSFSLKDMLNKTITAISKNLLKQQIFYSEWRIHHSPWNVNQERFSQVLGGDIRYIKWVKWQWTKPWWWISLQKVKWRKTLEIFKIESCFCSAGSWKLPYGNLRRLVFTCFFLKMGISH